MLGLFIVGFTVKPFVRYPELKDYPFIIVLHTVGFSVALCYMLQWFWLLFKVHSVIPENYVDSLSFPVTISPWNRDRVAGFLGLLWALSSQKAKKAIDTMHIILDNYSLTYKLHT